jgi:hypothetical protein
MGLTSFSNKASGAPSLQNQPSASHLTSLLASEDSL